LKVNATLKLKRLLVEEVVRIPELRRACHEKGVQLAILGDLAPS